jgi:hypothetical protein
MILFVPFSWLALVLKMAYPQNRSWCVLQLAKKELCNVQLAHNRYGNTLRSTHLRLVSYKQFEQKVCICKGKSLQSFCSNSFTRRKWIPGWEVRREVVCNMHVAQPLLTLSRLSAKHTNYSVVG